MTDCFTGYRRFLAAIRRQHTNALGLRLTAWAFLLSICGVLSPAIAQSSQVIEQAVRQYEQALDTPQRAARLERFRLAERLFSQVIDDHGIQNADLFVNLGNAALQCEHLGTAVLAYRRALAIAPAHVRARQNLDHARQLLPDWVPRPSANTLLDTFFVWHRMLSPSGQALVASLCFAAAAVAGAVAIRWRRTWARLMALLFGTVWIAAMGLLAWQTFYGGDISEAVITVPETVVRAADSNGAPARFAEPLPAGSEVTIVDRRDQWVRIRLADGRDGYVWASALGRIKQKPPATG